MKKKILKIVSSILGVFAICGLSLFSLLDHKKDSQGVSAEAGDVVVDKGNFSNTLSWSASNNDYTGVINFRYTGDYTYFVRYSGVVETIYLQFNIYYTFNFVDSTTQENIILTPSVSSFSSNEVQVGTDNATGVYSLVMSLTGTFAWSDPYLLFVSNRDSGNAVVVGYTDNMTFTPSGYPIRNLGSTPRDVIFSFSYTGNINTSDVAYNEGYDMGYQSGYNQGNAQGLEVGYQSGYAEGVASQQQLIADAYTNGYNQGYDEAYTADATVATVFSNILLVGMLPVDFFLRILNWEFLGINIASFVSALLSVAATIIVVRIVTGGKND